VPGGFGGVIIDDRVACLEAGADDKPYRSEDFEAGAPILAARYWWNRQLRFGDLVLDLATRKALRHGRAIELTMNLNCSNI